MNTVTDTRTTAPTDALWGQYRETGDPGARALLLDRYLGLVHHVARDIGRRIPSIEIDDLVGAGTLGLVRAIESFDLSRGLAFSTYAVQRIRGAILDALRAEDWTPRSVRTKRRQLEATVASLERSLGRPPVPREVADALGISMATYWQWRELADGPVIISFDRRSSGAGQPALEETLDDPDAVLPGDELIEHDRAVGLQAAIAALPERERTVLALYYYEGLNLRQIAEVLHVTESRISQVRTRALRRLRDMLAAKADSL